MDRSAIYVEDFESFSRGFVLCAWIIGEPTNVECANSVAHAEGVRKTLNVCDVGAVSSVTFEPIVFVPDPATKVELPELAGVFPGVAGPSSNVSEDKLTIVPVFETAAARNPKN